MTIDFGGITGIFGTTNQLGIAGQQTYIFMSNNATHSAGDHFGIFTNASGAWDALGDAPPADTINISLADPGTVSLNIGFGHIEYTPVPEPSTYAMIFGAASLLGVIYFRNFKKKNAK